MTPAANDDEARALLEFLDARRWAVLAIVDGRPDDALRRPVLPSGWTILGSVQHLASTERYWFRDIAAGQRVDDPWSEDDPDAARELLDGRTAGRRPNSCPGWDSNPHALSGRGV